MTRPARTPASPEFVAWVTSEMEERGWTISETARRAGLTHPTIGEIVTYGLTPSFETCIGLGRAFGIAPEVVMARAGLLPPRPAPDDETWVEWRAVWESADDEERNIILRTMREMLRALKGRGGVEESADGARGRKRRS